MAPLPIDSALALSKKSARTGAQKHPTNPGSRPTSFGREIDARFGADAAAHADVPGGDQGASMPPRAEPLAEESAFEIHAAAGSTSVTFPRRIGKAKAIAQDTLKDSRLGHGLVGGG